MHCFLIQLSWTRHEPMIGVIWLWDCCHLLGKAYDTWQSQNIKPRFQAMETKNSKSSIESREKPLLGCSCSINEQNSCNAMTSDKHFCTSRERSLSSSASSALFHLREWLSWWIHDCWDANWVLSVDTIASSFAYSTCASMYCIILLANIVEAGNRWVFHEQAS